MAAAPESLEMPAASAAQDIPVPDEQDPWDDQDPWSQAAPGLVAAEEAGGAVGIGALTASAATSSPSTSLPGPSQSAAWSMVGQEASADGVWTMPRSSFKGRR